MLADALLEEMVGGIGTSLSEHYDVFARGTSWYGTANGRHVMISDPIPEHSNEDEDGESAGSVGPSKAPPHQVYYAPASLPPPELRSALNAQHALSELSASTALVRGLRPGLPMTLVLLAGEGSPRAASRCLAQHIAARSGFRSVCVDLPGHGTLAAVSFSLARAERVLKAVIDREMAESSGRGPGGVYPGAGSVGRSYSVDPQTAVAATSNPGRASRVVLIAYGASAFVAAHFAACNPGLLAGVALVGTVPSYDTFSARNGLLKALYRLPWVHSLTSLGVLGKLQAKAAREAIAMRGAGKDVAAGKAAYRAAASSDFSDGEYEGEREEGEREEEVGLISPRKEGGDGRVKSKQTVRMTGTDQADVLGIPLLADDSDDEGEGGEATRHTRILLASSASGGLIPYRLRLRDAMILPSDQTGRSHANILLEEGHEWSFRVRPFYIRECQYASGYSTGSAGAGYVEGQGAEQEQGQGQGTGAPAPRAERRGRPQEEEPGQSKSGGAGGGGARPDRALRGVRRGYRSGRSALLSALAALPRPLLVLGPESWVRRAKQLLHVPQAKFAMARGVRDEILPSLQPRKADAIAAMLCEFAKSAFDQSDASLARVQSKAAEASAARARQRDEEGSGGGHGMGSVSNGRQVGRSFHSKAQTGLGRHSSLTARSSSFPSSLGTGTASSREGHSPGAGTGMAGVPSSQHNRAGAPGGGLPRVSFGGSGSATSGLYRDAQGTGQSSRTSSLGSTAGAVGMGYGSLPLARLSVTSPPVLVEGSEADGEGEGGAVTP